MMYTEKTALSPFRTSRLALNSALGLGVGGVHGAYDPADPEHRVFSAQAEGIGSGIGTGAGITGGYHAADALVSKAGLKGPWGFLARLLIPTVLGGVGYGLGNKAGRGVASARYNTNEIIRKATGQDTYQDIMQKRNEKARNIVMALAGVATTAAVGYGGYKLYDWLSNQKKHRSYNKYAAANMIKEAIIKKVNGKYKLYTKDGKRVLGTHSSKLKAIKQEYAIEKSQERQKVAGAVGDMLINSLKGGAKMYKDWARDPKYAKRVAKLIADLKAGNLGSKELTRLKHFEHLKHAENFNNDLKSLLKSSGFDDKLIQIMIKKGNQQ